jgi:hypothetical protein
MKKPAKHLIFHNRELRYVLLSLATLALAERLLTLTWN